MPEANGATELLAELVAFWSHDRDSDGIGPMTIAKRVTRAKKLLQEEAPSVLAKYEKQQQEQKEFMGDLYLAMDKSMTSGLPFQEFLSEKIKTKLLS